MKPTVSTPRNTIIDQKANAPVAFSDDRPGEQERHFQIEDDEQDGDQIKTHIEFHPRIVEGGKAAFIGESFSQGQA